MKFNKRCIVLILLLQPFFFFLPIKAQVKNKFTLFESIDMARKNSLDTKISTYAKQSSYWDFAAYKAGFLPKFSLRGVLPNYFRSINILTLPNGKNDFISQNVANSSLSLNLSQNVGFTGGNLVVSSSLQRLDNFGNNHYKSYTSVPLSVSYTQSNVFYNELKWRRKIEPLKLEESKRAFFESIENISYSTTEKFFALLKADIQLKLDQQNLKNIDTLLKISKSRFEIGTINLNELLQAQVSHLNARKGLSASVLHREVALQTFSRYLNAQLEKGTELELPEDMHFFAVELDRAITMTKDNRKYYYEFKRRKLEAQQEIQRTKSLTGPSFSINANIGLTQSDQHLGAAYNDLLRNQAVGISFYFPLMDWGVNKSNRKRAEANLYLEENRISQQEMTMEQDVSYQVMRWQLQKELIQIAKETRDLATRRYNVAFQKYTIGSLNFTDFNNALLDKDRATNEYVDTLQGYWLLYYSIRMLTLFDFERNNNLALDEQGGGNI
ncbi:Outer membrane protein TolC [Pedobacter suwonensis]|uniref:Outer membrane protein TolC n=1 Tax=Pedobacter suwonensis TaxID=332999 RepID=A0A1I0TQU4_9SPHI|nr:TolC family protein [Pedobacter suwonensis]SFA54135.1 Outer membrane protein TolC [Pedobacter suwonensis]